MVGASPTKVGNVHSLHHWTGRVGLPMNSPISHTAHNRLTGEFSLTIIIPLVLCQIQYIQVRFPSGQALIRMISNECSTNQLRDSAARSSRLLERNEPVLRSWTGYVQYVRQSVFRAVRFRQTNRAVLCIK